MASDNTLTIGSLIDSDGEATLRTGKFNRHTFWCGQSGSGKTYALGVVLERLLLESGLPMVIFDPNSDFVRLGTPQPTTDPETAERLRALDVRVLRPRGEGGADPLHVRYVGMDLASQAAVLRLDPIRDAEEFHVLRKVRDEYGPQETQTLVNNLGSSDDPVGRRIAMRVQNLGVANWDLWARGAIGVESIIDERPDATVLDLGSFTESEEAAAAALAVFDRLWAKRMERRPVLLVIDEAHNLCGPEPTTPARRALLERIIQIAAEGRKFGLWLLLSTQRPSKIHPQILSQCDNLCVMKSNAPTDLAQLAEYFGAVPAELFARVPGFSLGQSLFAGGFMPTPSIVQMAERFTEEGGSDVPVPLTRDVG